MLVADKVNDDRTLKTAGLRHLADMVITPHTFYDKERIRNMEIDHLVPRRMFIIDIARTNRSRICIYMSLSFGICLYYARECEAKNVSV